MTDRHPVYRRSRGLIIGIVAYLDAAENPVPWDDLLRTFSSEDRSWKTLENTIRDLEAFGAIHRIGKPADRRRPDSRALVATPLGRAWLDQEVPPLPGADVDDVPDDPFELAEAISDAVDRLEDDLRPDPFAD